jgi:hypothetical protein
MATMLPMPLMPLRNAHPKLIINLPLLAVVAVSERDAALLHRAAAPVVARVLHGVLEDAPPLDCESVSSSKNRGEHTVGEFAADLMTALSRAAALIFVFVGLDDAFVVAAKEGAYTLIGHERLSRLVVPPG